VHPAVGLVVAYLAGSIPSAYIAGRARGVDLRTQGSGNLGATNVVRVLGAKIGAAVFAVDMAKGALPVALLPQWASTPHPERWAIAYGIAAILGHVRPIFLLGRGGGKGVATAGGVFLALAPVAMLIALAVFAAVVYATGYVSLGSLTAAVTLSTVLAFTRGVGSPLFLIGAVVAAFVFWTHRANVGRLRRGEEHRFGRKKREAAGAAVDGVPVGPAAPMGSAAAAVAAATAAGERRTAPRPPFGRRRAHRPPDEGDA
jgi:glycerol-3-phosphate acyltransferase PlsY